jgi:hypothetical protein
LALGMPVKRRSVAGNCALCGVYRATLHRDHIVPKFLGGSDEATNIQRICANCHEDKSLRERVGWATTTPESRRKMSDSARRHRSMPGVKDRIRQQTTARWQDDDFRQSIRRAKSAHARVSPRGVHVIRAMRATGMTQQAIGDWLGVRREFVKDVLSGKLYAWVD